MPPLHSSQTKPAISQNEMIRASAGSGKTFQLTNRYIGLMAHGVEPERIIALTFTRKAAGEFFDAILEKLSQSATDESFCKVLAESPYIPDLQPADFLKLLRKLVSRMHLLHLGTLDSFFSNILRNFPFEFGLGGGFEILDDHLAATEQLRVYRQVFQRATPGQPQQEQTDFLEAFKLATFGSEESRLIRQLGEFIKSNHEIYLAAPSVARWGKKEAIWPTGWQWGNQLGKLKQFTTPLLDSLETDDLSAKQLERWQDFSDAAAAHKPGTPMAKPLDFLFKKIIEVYPDIVAGHATITVQKKQELNPAQCANILEITNRLVAGELENRLKRTRGIHHVINNYEKTYGRLVRRRGKLTFADLLIILTSADDSSPLLTQTPDEDARLQIDFRLDGRFDHWLLDEFQDTNYLQWRAIENLIDETLQDNSGQRSLFQVGDVKQAIYGWRGGDVRLFDEIKRRYPQITTHSLDISFRSGPAVIGTVNQVFRDAPAIALVTPDDTCQRWENGWEDHISKKQNLDGYTCLLTPEPGDGKNKADKQDTYATMLSVLEQVRPHERGIDCAILTQRNPTAIEIVDYVRAHSDIPIYSETDLHIAEDNPLTLALLALFQFAAHPGDTFAWQHLQMTPLGEIMRAEELDQTALSNEILTDLSHHGTDYIIQRWLARLEKNATPLDGFSRARAESFSRAAQTFDQSGSRNLDEFLSYAENYTVREPAAKGTVQVMTIHKSKGLGFDMVILPELGGNSIANARDDIGVQRAEDRHIEWVYDLPTQAIALQDPVLSEYLEQQKADAAYEALCKFYVAMTRAKQAMYLIAPAHGTSKSENFVKLLEETLAETEPAQSPHQADLAYATGNPQWFTNIKETTPTEPAPEFDITLPEEVRRPRHNRRTPSENATTDSEALQHGTIIHALFEQIEWLDETTPAELETLWKETVAEANEEHHKEVLQSLDAARPILEKPSPTATCRRELRFETLIDNDWVSGIIDRLVVEEDNATIIDFKTGTNSDPAQHRKQLELYRKIVTKMTGLDEEQIHAHLFFTKTGKIVV